MRKSYKLHKLLLKLNKLLKITKKLKFKKKFLNTGLTWDLNVVKNLI